MCFRHKNCLAKVFNQRNVLKICMKTLGTEKLVHLVWSNELGTCFILIDGYYILDKYLGTRDMAPALT